LVTLYLPSQTKTGHQHSLREDLADTHAAFLLNSAK
jgi:hypothetical protein